LPEYLLSHAAGEFLPELWVIENVVRELFAIDFLVDGIEELILLVA
jgi:hypothetical protein